MRILSDILSDIYYFVSVCLAGIPFNMYDYNRPKGQTL